MFLPLSYQSSECTLKRIVYVHWHLKCTLKNKNSCFFSTSNLCNRHKSIDYPVCFFLSFFLTHRTRMQNSRSYRRSVVRDARGQNRVCVEQIDDRSEPRDNLQHHLHHFIHHYCAQNDREEERKSE